MILQYFNICDTIMYLFSFRNEFYTRNLLLNISTNMSMATGTHELKILATNYL